MTDWMELYQQMGRVAFAIPTDSRDPMVLKARTGAFLALDALATMIDREDDPEFVGHDSFDGAFAETDWSAHIAVKPSGEDPGRDVAGTVRKEAIDD